MGGELRGRSQSTNTHSSAGLYERVGKRLLDGTLALVGLAMTLPLFLVIALAIRLNSKGPIFFRQGRIGRRGELFHIIKFRTMGDGAETKGPKLTASGDSRVTTVGKWLRKTKIDELPQLFNVLKGEMSFVGPRPEVPEYVATYTCTQKRVLEARPGLTGPASLAFIDEEHVLAGELDKENFYLRIVLPVKLDLDLAYCGTISFFGDIKLILLTVARTILRTKDPAEDRLQHQPGDHLRC